MLVVYVTCLLLSACGEMPAPALPERPSDKQTAPDTASDDVPIPRGFEVIPFALTNPIWVDQNGDGNFMAPGIPEWLERPVNPLEE